MWICPIGRNCNKKDPSIHWDTYRDGTTTIDEHMVNAHGDFRHRKGYAGKFLWRMLKKGTISHLNKTQLLKIVHMNQGFIPEYIARRDQALLGLQARFPFDDVQASGLADLPASMIRDPAEAITSKTSKKDMVAYLIEIRRHFALWEDVIFMAELIIVERDDQIILEQAQFNPVVDVGSMDLEDG